jgi:hypothetical protein
LWWWGLAGGIQNSAQLLEAEFSGIHGQRE